MTGTAGAAIAYCRTDCALVTRSAERNGHSSSGRMCNAGCARLHTHNDFGGKLLSGRLAAARVCKSAICKRVDWECRA